jgi:hypothetical protein
MSRSATKTTSSRRGRGRTGAALGALVLLGVAGSGCKGKGATGGCGDEGSLCGGNPVGTWEVTDTCSFPVVSRPAQNYDTTRGYFEPETGATPPAQTSGFWCWDLSFDTDGKIKTPATPISNPDAVQIETANAISRVTFSSDGTYLYQLTATSTTTFHVARSCFGVNGMNVSCTDFATDLNMSGIANNPSYMNVVKGQPSFQCMDEGDGCTCTFHYLETDNFGSAVGDKGGWVQDGNVIHHYSISGQGNLFDTSPTRRTVRDATFCQNGDTMVLTGANGQPIALKSGARTLYLKKIDLDAGTMGAAGMMGSGGGGSGGAGGEDAGSGGTGGAGGMDAAADGPSD